MKNFKVSVIIPLAPTEAISINLVQQLKLLPKDWEILICSSKLQDTKIFKFNNCIFTVTA